MVNYIRIFLRCKYNFHKFNALADLNKEAHVQVEVVADKDCLEIKRFSETNSRMFFSLNKRTDGVLSTPYGDISIEFFTHLA